MIIYNDNNINDWNLSQDNIVKVYYNRNICYQKMENGVTPPTPPTPSVTTAITYIASWKLDVVASRFTPNASAETYDYATSAGTIYFPSDVTSIGNSAFQSSYSLASIDIPSSVTSIGQQAFQGCSGLTSIDIPSGVTSIGAYAFYNCSGLTSITIPSGVTNIPSGILYGCNNLTSITINATIPPTLGNVAFYDTNNCPIYVPSGSVDAYKTASYNWGLYADRIQAIS